MVIVLYIFLSYMIMLGMMLESYDKGTHIPSEAWLMWTLSPIIFPILLGMILTETKDDKNE